jgi:hypothetical protein
MKGIRTYVAALVGLVGLVGTAGAVPTPFFDTVVTFAPGTGAGVVDYHDPISSYTGPSGPGTFDPAAVTALDRVRLALGGARGTPGAIVLGFSDGREFFNGPGADVQVYGNISWMIVEASQAGTTFFPTGYVTGWPQPFEPFPHGNGSLFTLVDLAPTGLAAAKFLRLTTYPPYTTGAGYPAGYNLDAAKALHFAQSPEPPAPTPEPSTWVLLGTGLLGLFGYGWRQRRSTP